MFFKRKPKVERDISQGARMISVCLVIYALAAINWIVGISKDVKSARSWLEVPGEIIEVNNGMANQVYVYEVEGKMFRSNQVKFGGAIETIQMDEGEPIPFVSSLNSSWVEMVQNKVKVYVNPEDPSDSVLDRGLPKIFFVHVILCPLAIVGGFRLWNS